MAAIQFDQPINVLAFSILVRHKPFCKEKETEVDPYSFLISIILKGTLFNYFQFPLDSFASGCLLFEMRLWLTKSNKCWKITA